MQACQLTDGQFVRCACSIILGIEVSEMKWDEDMSLNNVTNRNG
jgi:hypothetical protein